MEDKILTNPVQLVECEACKGSGREECCGGHMCPGDRDCFRCRGTGKCLSKEDKIRKKIIEDLLEYN